MKLKKRGDYRRRSYFVDLGASVGCDTCGSESVAKKSATMTMNAPRTEPITINVIATGDNAPGGGV